MTLDEIERRFHRAMISIYETAKRELGYNATRFLQMISEQGGLATARQLLWSEAPSEGFTTLWERNRLDLTVEAHVLLDEFAPLFTDQDGCIFLTCATLGRYLINRLKFGVSAFCGFTGRYRW
jgi:hypothetical protein